MKITKLVSQEKSKDGLVQLNNEDGDYIQIAWRCVYEAETSKGKKFRFSMDVPRGVDPNILVGFAIKGTGGSEVELELEKTLIEHGLSIGSVVGETETKED